MAHVIKDRLVKELQELYSVLPSPKRGDNTDPLLGEIFLWQEVKDYASSHLKSAWTDAERSGLVGDDNTLRNMPAGTNEIIRDSGHFSVQIKIHNARMTFDTEAFILKVAKKYHIEVDKLDALAATCNKEAAKPLLKRVLEA